MQPVIVEKGPIYLLGLGFFGDPFQISGGWTEENEIGRLWSRFMAFVAQHHGHIRQAVAESVAYEVHIYHPETMRTGEFEVFVGLEVAALEEVPLELSAKILPPATYAIFTLQGEQIVGDWAAEMFAEWLPQAGYEGDGRYSIQRYDERFKGLQQIEESVLEVYIPIRR
jgi:predicted transcriptional regulator YdeE